MGLSYLKELSGNRILFSTKLMSALNWHFWTKSLRYTGQVDAVVKYKSGKLVVSHSGSLPSLGFKWDKSVKAFVPDEKVPLEEKKELILRECKPSIGLFKDERDYHVDFEYRGQKFIWTVGAKSVWRLEYFGKTSLYNVMLCIENEIKIYTGSCMFPERVDPIFIEIALMALSVGQNAFKKVLLNLKMKKSVRGGHFNNAVFLL